MKYLYVLQYKELVLLQYENKPDFTYWYNEHTCPVNYLKCTGVIDLETGDIDPHGIFKVRSVIPCTEEQEGKLDYWLSCCNVYGKMSTEGLINKINEVINDTESD